MTTGQTRRTILFKSAERCDVVSLIKNNSSYALFVQYSRELIDRSTTVCLFISLRKSPTVSPVFIACLLIRAQQFSTSVVRWQSSSLNSRVVRLLPSAHWCKDLVKCRTKNRHFLLKHARSKKLSYRKEEGVMPLSNYWPGLLGQYCNGTVSA